MEQRLSLVGLGVRDLERAKRFYVDGLGWRPSSASTDQICFIQLGGIALALYSWDALAEEAGLEAEGSGFRGVTLAHNARSREDVDAVLELAEKAGAEITKPAEDVFWGGYSGYFRDPEGHLWEVAWNPFFAIDEAGNLALPEPN